MSFKEFIGELSGKRLEGELIKTMLVSFVASSLVLSLLYFFRLQFIEDFNSKYGYFLFFAILSYAIIMPAVRQARAFKEFPCMSGMMIGMTFGMIFGFLPGFFIGATNGMFYGSVFGVSVGIFFGIMHGKCCGIMGVMEGLMAGFMGGLMGAMTAVMMLNDNLKIATVFVFFISAIIIFSLNYMIYKESKGVERHKKESYWFIIVSSALLTLITTLVMVYGPRSVLFG